MDEQEDRAELPPDWFTALWHRVKDHRIAQWTVGYVAIAYGIQHGVTLTADAFDWPHAMTRVSMLLLVLGLPVAMTLAWYHGDRANRRVSGGEFSIVSLLLVAIAILFYVFVRPDERATTALASSQQASIATAAGGGIPIAVLPFANVSGDPSQEFFSDGMTDEIIAALAKVPSILVVARTSAFQFKGEKKDMRAIAQALNARYLIDGSVRKAGDRVRITAQLVRAENGVGIWSESYDRDVKDVFAVQEDIAQAIASSLRTPLGLKQGETLVRDRTQDLASYDEYLRARSVLRSRGSRAAGVTEGIKLLESVVARDPKFAPAWALLARAYILSAIYNPDLRATSPAIVLPAYNAALDNAERAAREAIQLDERSGIAYAVLATVEGTRGDWGKSDALYRKALATGDANDPEVLQAYGVTLQSMGRAREALAIDEKLRTLEPFVPIFNIISAAHLVWAGKATEAIVRLESVPPDARSGYYRNVALSAAYAQLGRYEDSARALLSISAENLVASRQNIDDAVALLRNAPNKIAREKMPDLPGDLAYVYAYVGAPERSLDYPERFLPMRHGFDISFLLYTPQLAGLRRTGRFKNAMRKAGLVDYWRATGWPDVCHPIGADDFECS